VFQSCSLLNDKNRFPQTWCKSNMKFPDPRNKTRGHFVSNGEFVWWAFSDGKDSNKDCEDITAVLDDSRKVVNTVIYRAHI
jgi:hypothetical protein